MPEELLPIYQIQDFTQASGQGPGFYLNRIESHLQQHTFIQKPHKHDFYLILLFIQGTGTHTIDFNTYPVGPRAIFFLRPGQVHAWQLSADTTGFILFFNDEFYRLCFPQHQIYRFPFFNTLRPKPLLMLTPSQAPAIHTLFRNIAQEHRNRSRYWEEAVGSYLHILLISLSRIYEMACGPAVFATTTMYPAPEHLQNLFEQHFKQHQPISFYAEKLHLSTRQLNDMSRKTWGKSALELLQERLLLEARRLLTHSGLTITQVAAELGYFDNSYFARFFKKHTGQTPEQFRQSIA